MMIRKAWNYEDDLVCCREYLRFALGETAAKSIRSLIEDLAVKLPHISKGSLRMKLQNIKQISVELNLNDGVQLSPLDQYSVQSKRAFKQAIQEIVKENPPFIPCIDPAPVRPIILSQDLDDFLDIFMSREYLNEAVTHKRFGEGTITEINLDYLTATFADRCVKFVYPNAFKRFLRFKNQSLQNRMDEFFSEIQKR